MSLATGARLGPYEILGPLDAHGMGEVYTARDTRLGRKVALKVLPFEFAGDAKMRLRFEQDAKAIAALNHPHICPLYEVGPDYFVMEPCEGTTLARLLMTVPFSTAEVVRHGIEIADALEKAHQAGVIHGALKPSNVIMTKAGLKILGFGLAGPRTFFERAKLQRLTGEGDVLGAVGHMAPELFDGNEPDERTDVFGLGLLLYEMASGCPAFTGNSRTSVIAAIRELEPTPLSELQPATPIALDRFIRACLRKNPDERIQTARDAMTGLRATREPDHSIPPPRATRPWKRWLGLALLLGAALIPATLS